MVIPGATMAREGGIDNSVETERGTRRDKFAVGSAMRGLFVVRVFSPMAGDPLLRDNQGGEVVDNRRTLVRADCERQPGDRWIFRDWHVFDARHPYLGDRSWHHRDTEFRRHQITDGGDL